MTAETTNPPPATTQRASKLVWTWLKIAGGILAALGAFAFTSAKDAITKADPLVVPPVLASMPCKSWYADDGTHLITTATECWLLDGDQAWRVHYVVATGETLLRCASHAADVGQLVIERKDPNELELRWTGGIRHAPSTMKPTR